MASRLKSQPVPAPSPSPGGNGDGAAHLRALETKAPTVSKPIVLPDLDIRMIEVTVVGDSELICHNWSQKQKQQILDKQMQRASAGKEPKNPDLDYQESLYRLEGGGFGFPSIAFKDAAVAACTSLGKSVTKVAARQAFHIQGKYVAIRGKPKLREDMVRVGRGVADIRYRAEFAEWETTLTISYNARVLSDEQIVNMLNTAGFAVGIGEWRPERNGQSGRFHVKVQESKGRRR